MRIPTIKYNELVPEEVHISFSTKCMETLGVMPNNTVIDGKIHRFGRDGRCWYVLHESKRGTGTIYGHYGDWSQSGLEEVSFCSKGDNGLTSEERKDAEEQRRLFEAEKKRLQEEITKEMVKYYNSLPQAISHPYLERKGVKAGKDLRVDGDTLIIPLYGNTGEIQTLQKISPRGEKKLYYGLSSSYVRYIFPGNTHVFLCEGYATGASIHEATGATVICAMFAGNIPKIAKDYKGAIVVADNDKSGTGEKVCEGLDYILIPELGMDANDYAQAYGMTALNALLLPEKEDDYFVSISDMLKEPTFPPYLIKGMFSMGQIGMMVGASGTGKSFTLLDMMMSLTSGLGSWHGKKCKKANAVYLCGEGFEGVKVRMKAWQIEHGLASPEELGNLHTSRYAKDLTNLNDLADIIERIKRYRDAWGSVDLVVIDTYNQFNSGDENAADSAHAFLANIGKIQREFGCCLILSHHTGLGQDAQRRARGSSVILGAMDFAFLVEKDPDNDQFFSLTTIKQKDIEKAPPMGFEMKQVSIDWLNEDGDNYTSTVLVSRDMKKADLRLAPCFEIYSLFKDYWVQKEEHYYSEEGDYWVVPRGDMEEFVMLWKKVKEGKEITRESAYRSLKGDREITKAMGAKMQKGDKGYYLIKKPSGTKGQEGDE